MFNLIRLPAKPSFVTVDLTRSCLIVVDMQNAFLSYGGMFDIVGFDISRLRRIIEPAKRVLASWREAGLETIYIRHVYSRDLSNAGGPESPNYWKEYCLALARSKPESMDKLLIEGSWGSEIIDEVRPLPGDIVIDKQRYSGFVNTKLEDVLKQLKAKYLFFIGIALNICVESTVRDAFFREFWPIVVSDCCEAIGPNCARRASLWNISNLFGWITSSRSLIKILKKS